MPALSQCDNKPLIIDMDLPGMPAKFRLDFMGTVWDDFETNTPGRYLMLIGGADITGGFMGSRCETTLVFLRFEEIPDLLPGVPDWRVTYRYVGNPLAVGAGR